MVPESSQRDWRLADAIKSAIAYYEASDSEPESEEKTRIKQRAAIERVEIEHQSSAAIYQVFPLEQLSLSVGDTIPEMNTALLAEDILKIVHFESPIHVKMLSIRLLSAVGSSRSGARINRSNS